MAADTDPKLALTRRRILNEAIAVADVEGVEALSMRKLAERLGVGAMSLYRHVANKDEMIEAMVDAVCAEIDRPGPDGDWRHQILASADSAHRVLLAHRWVADQWTRRRPGSARARYMDALLGTLQGSGLDPGLVYRGYHAITMHIVGFTIQELGYQSSTGPRDLDDGAEEVVAGLLDAGLPHLADHVRAHVVGDDDGDEFAFVLRLILDGLERADH